VTATTTFVNGGTAAESNVNVTLAAPSGWTMQAVTPASFASVAGGQTVQTTWHLTAPSGAAAALCRVGAGDAGNVGPYTDAGTINVAYPSSTPRSTTSHHQ